MEFHIHVDLSGVIPPGAAFDAAHFPSLQRAVKEAAELGRARWAAYAAGATLPSGLSVPARFHKAYSSSISLEQVGDFEAVVSSDFDKAELLDRGLPAYDMKRMLDSSAKVKSFADGRRYLIIPFKWAVPGLRSYTGGNSEMNHEVRGWWRGKTRSVASPGHETEWGTRFKRGDAIGLGLDPDQPGKARNQVGMHAFRKPGAVGGAAANASFQTFRTMCDGQTDKWIIPAKPPLQVVETAAAEARAEAERSFVEAAVEDLNRLTSAMGPSPTGGKAIRKLPGRRRGG